MSSNEASSLPSSPRMGAFSKLRKFLGLKGSSRPSTAPGRYSSYGSDELESRTEAEKKYDDFGVLEERSESPHSRTLYHSLSSPALRKQEKNHLSSAANDARSPFLVITLLNDLEPTVARQPSKSRRPKTASQVSELERRPSLSLNGSMSSLRRKGSKLWKQSPRLPIPDAGVIDLSISPEEAEEGSKNDKLLQPTQSPQAVDPITPLSATTAFTSIYSQERPLTSTTSLDSMTSFEKETVCRKRSANKLARTLGGCPPEYSRTYFADPRADASGSVSPTPQLPPLTTTKPKKTRRKSLTLTNLGSLTTLIRSNSQSVSRLTHSSSRATLSTVNPDDVHKHGLNDLGNDWGEMRDDATNGMCTPISPILFNPPSPLPAPAKKSPWSEPDPSEPIDSNPSDSQRPVSPSAALSVPSSPPSRRHSLLSGRRRSQSYAPARSSQQFLLSPRPRTPFDSYTPSPSPLPVKANWLDEPASSTVSQSQVGREEQVQTEVHVVRQQDDWSGQWNQDNMLDVVKALRNLK